MSDVMRPLAFDRLMIRALEEFRAQGRVFGVSRLYRCARAPLPLPGGQAETPFGPAAGPHTQLAQNIVSAYAAGARVFELKTVQAVDGADLSRLVPKPCIYAADEGYNCEWSTELTVPQALEESVKAWFALSVLSREMGLGAPDGFVFHMSVGYDLDGIRTPKVDAFLEGLRDASGAEAFARCRAWLLDNLARFERVNRALVEAIPAQVSQVVTLSTLHGCPPEEIERIAAYLLEQKRLHTFVKLNPTLLGYDFVRQRLNRLGDGDLAFDERHFREDLQWADAVPMLGRLQALAKRLGLTFGVKLSNTFPVQSRGGALPAQEVYLSGRALYPLTIALARRVAEAFNGQMRISFSGGAEARNLAPLLKAGLWPVTVATTLLKPGGYDRLRPMADALDGSLPAEVDVDAVRRLDDAAADDPLYRRRALPEKLEKPLPLLDCFTAPCREGCPLCQDIPAYLSALRQGRTADALRIILERNALPFITGAICPQTCARLCMRGYYEGAVSIREAKRRAAWDGLDAVLPTLSPAPARAGKRVAVVGGGPAGLAAASFLSRAGVEVTLWERRETLGGVVRHAIPAFRIDAQTVERDVALCAAYGATFHTGCEAPENPLKEGYTDVVLAVGAWKPGKLELRFGQAMDALAFLQAARYRPDSLRPGTDVAVVGGGDTAVDAARAALRLPGVEHVRLIYRRTRRYMPAAEDELRLALSEGVTLLELLSPVGVRDGALLCEVMALGSADESGRRRPESTGQAQSVPASLVVAAVGARVDAAPFTALGAALDRRGLPVTDAQFQTSVAHVYAIGDCLRGPATVAQAVADAGVVAQAICGAPLPPSGGRTVGPCAACGELSAAGDRCLGCEQACEVCVQVCPNRANAVVEADGRRQILHLDALCNECGNCAVFCPYSGAPYRDKPTLFACREDFDHSENPGFWLLGGGRALVRLNGQCAEYDLARPGGLPEDLRRLILAVERDYAYLT